MDVEAVSLEAAESLVLNGKADDREEKELVDTPKVVFVEVHEYLEEDRVCYSVQEPTATG